MIRFMEVFVPLTEGIHLLFWQIIIYILIRVIYFYKVPAFNSIFTIFSSIRTFKSLREKKKKIRLYMKFYLEYIV